jgi:hypothetical protein
MCTDTAKDVLRKVLEVNYPSREQREAFVRDLSELETKYGFSIDVSGWEYDAGRCA